MAGKSQQGTTKARTAGFDRAVSELNAFLMVLAIGLGVLDATCFVAFKVRDSLPSTDRAHAGAGAAIPAPRSQSPAAITPSRPGGTAVATGS